MSFWSAAAGMLLVAAALWIEHARFKGLTGDDLRKAYDRFIDLCDKLGERGIEVCPGPRGHNPAWTEAHIEASIHIASANLKFQFFYPKRQFGQSYSAGFFVWFSSDHNDDSGWKLNVLAKQWLPVNYSPESFLEKDLDKLAGLLESISGH
ncbi:MAG TPA: hypothetical protein VFK07_00825, partial [Candidatus Paceibacterota bacterium]|nr:hypothetical protein [Candidatus Paceibacterota bacterium]